MVNNTNSYPRHKGYDKMLAKDTSISYMRCEVIEDFADTMNSIENVFKYKIDNVLTGDAVAEIVSKINSVASDVIVKVVSWLKPVISVHDALSKEDAVISIVKILGLNIQKFQSSLEDALSFTSLLMGLLSTLSLILILVFFI